MAPMPPNKIRARDLSAHSGSDFNFSQAQMDALSPEQLVRYDEIIKERTVLGDELRDMVTPGWRRRADEPAAR